jgi:hypothetical protein
MIKKIFGSYSYQRTIHAYTIQARRKLITSWVHQKESFDIFSAETEKFSVSLHLNNKQKQIHMSYKDCTLLGNYNCIEDLISLNLDEQLKNKSARLFLIVKVKEDEFEQLKQQKNWIDDDAITLPPSIRESYNKEGNALVLRITNYTVNVYDISSKRALWTAGPLQATANSLLEMMKPEKELAII